MGSISKNLIHRDHWNNHLVEIFDEGDIRSLYFAGNVLQSSMSLTAPHRLVLSYTHYMMAPLLFNNSPERVLIIGIGAGSMLRFFHRYIAKCSIDAIDNSPHVIKLAKKYFCLPESPDIRLFCQDGFEFLLGRQEELYDLVLVDAFDQTGMSSSVYNTDFFDLCRNRLKKGGIASFNLWSGNASRLEAVTAGLGRTFPSVIRVPVPNRGNVICLAGTEDELLQMMETDYQELSHLSDEMQINFKKIARLCTKHNLGFKQRITRLFS